jgi:very-short-patch-repair endonuclease
MKIILIIIIFIIIALLKLKMNQYSYKRELSKCESPIEEMMLEALYEKGLKPYTQIPCGRYRIDIVVKEKYKKIAIECDGKEFHSSNEQVKNDEQKNYYLRKKKYEVIRFTGSEIYRNKNWCAEVVYNRIKK